MYDFLKRWGFDIASFVLFALVPFGIAFLLGLQASGFRLYFPLIALFSLISIPYRNTFKRYITIFAISQLPLLAIVQWGANNSFIAGMAEFYVYALFIIIFVVIVGFLVTKTYFHFFGNRVSPSANKIIVSLAYVLIITFSIFSIVTGAKTSANLSNVTLNKSNFIGRIGVAIGKNQLTQYTDKELIDLGITSGIYKNNGDQILDDYGGDIRIEKTGQNVDLVFEGIPAKEDCFNFYFMNSPDTSGFTVTKVDGITEPTRYSSNSAIDSYKNEVCYSGKDTVSVEFIGSIQDIAECSTLNISKCADDALK